jgi:hypothetical protein
MFGNYFYRSETLESAIATLQTKTPKITRLYLAGNIFEDQPNYANKIREAFPNITELDNKPFPN